MQEFNNSSLDLTKLLSDASDAIKSEEISRSIAYGMSIPVDVKEGRAWVFKCPQLEEDLEFQIFFKQRFSDLLVAKKISRLVLKIQAALESDSFPGDFHIDVLPEAKCIVITQKGFWKNFASSPEEFVRVVEEACEAVL